MKLSFFSTTRFWQYAIAFSFFVLAVYVSLQQSVWLDEGLTILFSHYSIPQIMQLAQGDLHPPLYNLFLHALVAPWGSPIFMYRAWSIIFYVLSSFLFAAVVKKKFSSPVLNKKSYLVGFVLFLSSPFALYYATEVRSYMAVVLIALVRFWYFDELSASESSFSTKKFQKIGYTLSSVVALYLFYPFIFSLIAEACYLFFIQRKKILSFLTPWTVIILAYLPWIGAVLLHRLAEKPGHFLAIPWWQIPAIVFVGFTGGRVAITDLNHLHHYWPTILNAGLYFAVLFSAVYYWFKQRKRDVWVEKVFFLFLGPFSISLFISVIRFPVFDPRYYAEIFPFFLLIVTSAVISLAEQKKRLQSIALFALMVAHISILLLFVCDPWYAREPWKYVVPELEAESRPNDAVVFIGYNQPPPTFSLYSRGRIDVVSTYPVGVLPEDYSVIAEYLKTALNGREYIWYSQFLEWQKDPEKKIRALIERDFVYRKTIGFFKVKFDLYERRK